MNTFQFVLLWTTFEEWKLKHIYFIYLSYRLLYKKKGFFWGALSAHLSAFWNSDTQQKEFFSNTSIRWRANWATDRHTHRQTPTSYFINRSSRRLVIYKCQHNYVLIKHKMEWTLVNTLHSSFIQGIGWSRPRTCTFRDTVSWLNKHR